MAWATTPSPPPRPSIFEIFHKPQLIPELKQRFGPVNIIKICTSGIWHWARACASMFMALLPSDVAHITKTICAYDMWDLDALLKGHIA
jgi:hypothetical protein